MGASSPEKFSKAWVDSENSLMVEKVVARRLGSWEAMLVSWHSSGPSACGPKGAGRLNSDELFWVSRTVAVIFMPV